MTPRCAQPLRDYGGERGRLCGRPAGHTGQCLSPASLNRKVRWRKQYRLNKLRAAQ